MKLKLADMANIAEVVGAVAIVVSLIYVGVQVNDSTLAVRSATATETSAAISAWYAAYLSGEQTLDVKLRESLVNTITGVREQPGFLMYWRQRRDLFDPEFRAFMDDLVVNGQTNRNLEQIYLPVDPE